MTTGLTALTGLLTAAFLIGLTRFTFPNWKKDGRLGGTATGLTTVGGGGTGFGMGGVTTTGGFGGLGGAPGGGFTGRDGG